MENVLSSYERAKMIIASVFVTIFGIAMIYFGIKLVNAPIREGKTTGKVFNRDNNNNIDVKFEVDGQTYYVKGQGGYGIGTSVGVIYDTNNPSNARLSSSMTNRSSGFLLIGLALIIMIVVYTITYFDFKSKSFAAVSGGLDVAQQLYNL